MKTTNNNRHGRLAQRNPSYPAGRHGCIGNLYHVLRPIDHWQPRSWFPKLEGSNSQQHGRAVLECFHTEPIIIGSNTSRNIGFCLTNSGDCVGINSALFAPGAIPFWGMTYNSAANTGGGQDTLVYFKGDNKHLRATLQLQLSTVDTEINEFGWFETNLTGTTLGPIHRLFQGSGVPTGSLVPSPVGKEVTFKPTKYFGFYYKDVSEGGCLAIRLPASQHTRVVQATCLPSSPRSPVPRITCSRLPDFDPPGCGDGDCNLTLVRIGRRRH